MRVKYCQTFEPVQRGCFDDFSRDRLQTGQKHEHHERRPLPDIDNHDGRQRVHRDETHSIGATPNFPST